MRGRNTVNFKIALMVASAVSVCLCMTARSMAYIDLAPTLAKIISDSKKIAIVEVAEYDSDKRLVSFKEVRSIKGDASTELVQHEMTSNSTTVVNRQVMQWIEPGARAILFTARNMALVCIGQGWYEVKLSGGTWKLGANRPDLPLAYYGSLSRLVEGIEQMLAGKTTVLTVVAHGADDEGASFDLALNRTSLPALVRVQRIRANMSMPAMVMAASGSQTYMVGPGPIDPADLPILTEKLKSADAVERSEAADNIRFLGRKAKAAATRLADLLQDSSPNVRFSAAAALLQVGPADDRAVKTLAAGLQSDNSSVRRDAAKATGLAGSAVSSLVSRLTELLSDADETMRLTALQAIAMLGPVASDAVPVVTKLLDDSELNIDAADALGRIGLAAQPALTKLSAMLSSDKPTICWAAVRAMSQIGGQDAHPAVDFMVRVLKGKCTEVEGYNIMIYLSLLGPVAADASSAVQSVRIKNPVLPSATLWAMAPEKSFPWSGRGRMGMPGFGFGGGGPGGPGGGDIALLIYQAYVHELDYRLKPAAIILAKKIMDGTAGDVPVWGYDILSCGRQEVVDILSPHLVDNDLVMRERAAVALGYMGAYAASARDQVAAAIGKAETEGEKRLLQWCLREITRD